MADNVDKKTRSRIMSKIRSKDTKPEKWMEELLDKNRIHYVKHDSDLPGKPDFFIHLKGSHDMVILVDGCFWHMCPDHWKLPQSNRHFWQSKFDKNFHRDRSNNESLLKMNLKVVRVWECELKSNAGYVIKRILKVAKNKTKKVYYVPDKKRPKDPKKRTSRSRH